MSPLSPLPTPVKTCALPTSLPGSRAVQPGADPIVLQETNAAIDDLSKRTGIPKSDIKVVSVEAVEWPETSLGCPQPDKMYAESSHPAISSSWKPAVRCMHTIPLEPVLDSASPKSHDLPTVAARTGVARPTDLPVGRHDNWGATCPHRSWPDTPPHCRVAGAACPPNGREGRLHPALIAPSARAPS